MIGCSEKANLILDENGARFHTLTNSIGEHWDSVGGMDADDFQDLFEFDTPADGNAGAVQIGGGEQQQQQIQVKILGFFKFF